ncbi:tetratricopeptide repeat protein [Planctomyces sp. SH-PL62]|uniref:tetratricopeptide repeat protein n=1 Tax=Planctomyces sp. SH-PL62 TaxID=1636152 RepID=UPI00078E742B|nr:tetratricopeptide repeat protein [Planctomyces sp. SH-PL62]AMV36332.1 tetratricopeptide repeat protein [Planctomyces sp. SH-PL62]
MARIELVGVLITGSLLAAGSPPSFASAEQAAGGKAQAGPGGGDPTQIPAAASSGWGWGWGWYRPYPVVRGTPNGPVTTVHVPFGGAGGGAVFWALPPSSGPTVPVPPPGFPRPAAVRPTFRVKKADLERAERYTTYGDRMFRVGNLKRAEDRYRQAIRLNPHVAGPRLRLAQVALVRERYSEAADLLREAETAEPGWILTAKDVQALYAEPADFARHLARLEEHLHQKPEDRDAWLVLGAQWFLSRRENKAADVFLRLDDPRRKPDVALAAFLDAARLRDREPPPLDPVAPEPGRDPFQPPAP